MCTENQLSTRTKTPTRLTFSIKRTKKFNFSKIYPEHFSITKTKNSLSTSVFIFSTISQILKIKFYVFFGHKHLETGANCSHGFAIFFSSITCP